MMGIIDKLGMRGMLRFMLIVWFYNIHCTLKYKSSLYIAGGGGAWWYKQHPTAECSSLPPALPGLRGVDPGGEPSGPHHHFRDSAEVCQPVARWKDRPVLPRQVQQEGNAGQLSPQQHLFEDGVSDVRGPFQFLLSGW